MKMTVDRPGVKAVLLSANRKLGRASATYVSQETCPNCRFRGNGCYAETGPAGLITRALNLASMGAGLGAEELAELEADALAELPAAFDLRLHVVGDTPTRRGARLLASACERWASAGRRPWKYTHASRVRREDWGPVSTLASVETLAQTRSAVKRGFVPALTVRKFPSAAFRFGGLKMISCLYQTRGTDCVTCGLCLDDTRLRSKGYGIAFQLHGSNTRRVSLPVLARAA